MDERLVSDSIIVRAWEVSVEELLRQASESRFMFLLKTLRGLLHEPHPTRQALRAAGLIGRRERFDTLMGALGKALASHAEQLRRVGDSPA